MFDSLKKKFSSGIKKLSEKVKEEKKPEELLKSEQHVEKAKIPEPLKGIEQPAQEIKEEVPKPPEMPTKEPEEIPVPQKPESVQQKRVLGRLKERITESVLSESDIDSFFNETEPEFLQANVALEVIDHLKNTMKENLADKPIKRGKTKECIEEAFRDSLYEIMNHGSVDLNALAERKPAKMVFLGFNGSGKTTTIAKVAKYLKDRNHRPVLAAADTFRAASIEQLEHHGKKLGIRVVKHKYGADPAAVVFDAVKHAEKAGNDFVLADTAGRMHVDKNLMDELKKIVRVNKPDLKVLVVDSLTGNDAVEQARKFNEAVGVDAVVLTKIDVNEKGGSILSVCYAIKKPIIFLGTGQGYEDLQAFDAREFVDSLMGH